MHRSATNVQNRGTLHHERVVGSILLYKHYLRSNEKSLCRKLTLHDAQRGVYVLCVGVGWGGGEIV
jgi:hypothetical protein